MPAQKLLLIGWDAADWKVIHPLIEQGKMPALQRMMQQGCHGNLATLYPVLSPTLWTSIATGKRPFNHGILGFSEPTPDGSSIRPITNLQRKTKALWNILQQNGKTSNVVGWWPSHPAEPINGVMVSNHYQRASGDTANEWPMSPGTVHPVRLEAPLKDLRFHPSEITPDMVLPFLPKASEIDQANDSRLKSLMKIFSDCTSIHSAATWLMQNEPADFTAIYYDAIDHISHGFMKYHPPQREGVPDKDFSIYQGTVEGIYRYHDMMLDTLLQLTGEDTTVILMSDHGFHPDHLRPAWIPKDPAGPAIEHREHGIFVMKGPGIRKNHKVNGANVIDVMPTILAAYDLPLGEDLDGSPLLDIFETPPTIKKISSWDHVDGDAGLHPPGTELSAKTEEETLKQLEDLGYIEKADPYDAITVLKTRRELDYNLACSYMHADRHGDAQPILEDLYRDHPGEYRIGLRLALCYQALGHLKALRSLIKGIDIRRRHDAETSRAILESLKELSEDDLQRMTPDQVQEIRNHQSLARLNPRGIDSLMAHVLIAEGDAQSALDLLEKQSKETPQAVSIHVQRGQAFLKLGRSNEALAAFQEAKASDPHRQYVYLGIAQAHLQMKHSVAACDAAREAIALNHSSPMAHFLHGQALLRLSRIDDAVEAFETALLQNPVFPQAHQRLYHIAHRMQHDPYRASYHLQKLRELRNHTRKEPTNIPIPPIKGGGREEAILKEIHAKELSKATDFEYNGQPITVVTGLPRSGTSMLMQMLAAAGMTITTDHHRPPDEDNPAGYLEDDRVKTLHQSNHWVKGEGGKIIKVVLPLVQYLPEGPDYRILFLERNLDEILCSQEKMLTRSNKPEANLDRSQLKETYQLQIDSVKKQLKDFGVPHLILNYEDIVADPQSHSSRIASFLGHSDTSESMAHAVRPDLYRNRQMS